MFGWGGLGVISLVCFFLFFFRFLLLLLFIYLFVFNLIENFHLKHIARRYFVVDKKKRLLDKLVELQQFYVISNRNQVLFHWKCTFLLFGFSTKIMSDKYSFECAKFYTSWFCDVKLQLDIFVDLCPLEIFFNFF